jgi:integrase
MKMAGLKRLKNGDLFARKGIPVDIRDAYTRLYGVRWEATLRLPAGTSNHEAKTRLGEWLAEIETRIGALRATANGEGQPLTRVNANALAGRWYNWFVAHQNDSEPPKHWRELGDYLIWKVIHPEAPNSYHERPKADPHWEWAKEPKVRQAVMPQVAEMARVATFLANEGLALDERAYGLFVNAVSDNLQLALALLERRALGDYSHDDTVDSFPAFTDSPEVRVTGVDCWQLFAAYVKAAKPATGTVQRWRAVFLNLQEKFPETSATSLSEADARAWVQGLSSPERSPQTIREVWLPAARRAFGWGVDHQHVRQNPFLGIKVDVPKQTRSRETKAFRHDEIKLILNAAEAYTHPKTPRERTRRWAPWLCAYSGARAGEITQLRGSDIEQRGDFHILKLTPDAGTIKTRQTRIVPIHEHLVAQGFLEMVKRIGDGPLFYNPSGEKKVEVDPLKPSRSRASTERAHLSSWVREVGVVDPEVSPTHGWRHTFKQTAERVGISEKVHDAITGHTAATEGRKYGAPTAEDMAAALWKFPRYEF